MKNQWLEIELDEYENHMAMPSIGQSQYLSDYLKLSIQNYKPKSIALIGCSGGNGLSNINSAEVERVVCVDINPKYLAIAKERFSNSFNQIEFISQDITTKGFSFASVDLIFVGLVFEYVNIDIAVNNLARLINKNDKLVTVLQLINPDIPEVSPSPYKKLEILNNLFSFVSPEEFLEICKNNGLGVISKKKTKLNSGKEFVEIELQKH